MKYRFARENKNYADYSSGRVFYNLPGTTSFPVRLASEIYQRCAAVLLSQGFDKPYTVYDPCCGGAYLLTTLGYLHGDEISSIYASDIDGTVISLAEKNLSLLSQVGLGQRIDQITEMIADFGKKSHLEALHSALKFKNILKQRRENIEVKCFIADITTDRNLIDNVSNVNIIITDLPYGDIVSWSGIQNEKEAIKKLLDNVFPVLSMGSVVSIVTKKKVGITHQKYKKVEQFIIGKRKITILQPVF